MTRSYNHIGSIIDVYRYDRLTDDPLDTFANGMVLRAAEIIADDLRVDLWWSINGTIDADYIVSAVILDENGQLMAQLDAQPQNNTRPTTSFGPDELVYDPRVLDLADGVADLPPGTYQVAVRVYRFADGAIQPVFTVDGAPDMVIGSLTRP